MAAEIIQINTQDLTTQTYVGQDTNLISTFDITASLSSSSYIEYFIYDLNQNLLTTEYNYTQYTILNDGQSAGSDNTISNINIDPEQSLITDGFDQGSYITYYNFLNNKIGSNIEQLYIAEISSDRTEVRLDSTILSNLDIVEKTNAFIQERNNSIYFLDFYLNFGDNQLLISNNINLDNQDPNNPTIFIKLYEPLPSDFDLNSTLWVVTSIEEPVAYQVNFEDDVIIIQDTTSIKGPNFNLDLKDQVNNSSLELSYTDLISTSLTSSQNQLNSLLEEKEIDINIDYTNFNNFIHFSSVQTRLENFYYKVSLIEQYSSSIAILNSTNSSSIAVGETSTVLENKIDNIITNFDGYDYYLYYSSGSYAWPKTTTEPPYQLSTTTDPAVLTWFGSTNEASPYFGGIINSASLFDNENKDNLLFSIPEFLRDDSDNSQYELFIDLVAQHFDNIWIYYKDVTEKFDADNRLESGISKDIVADAIRDFGIKLYQNNFSNEDLFTAFLGLTPEGGLFPFPNITGSLPTPSGYEYIDTLISASNDYLPLDDVNKSLYKRIYHNLPYLLKAKGTIPGLRALITSYGIPDTVLRINEYGGKDKVEGNDWDYWQNEFNYTFKTEGNNFISSSWNNLNWNSTNNSPETLAFRFKTDGLPETNIPYSQSLWNKGGDVHLVLKYTGSGYVSGSYSGSIIDPYYQYALLDFYPNYTTAPNESSSLYLPFFNGEWWSVMITRDGSSPNFTLSAGNKIYEGGDNGTVLGFYTSSIITASIDSDWYNNGDSYFASSSIINGETYTQFSGSLQEIRYYINPINEKVFKDYIMNPYSIEGNSLNSGPNELAFRASLGGELYTGSLSIHPKVTGSWITTSSFTSGNDFYFNSTPTFVPNTEYFFYDQPIAGIQNAVSDKVRLEDNIMPSGDTLSAYRRIAQNSEVSASYTPATNLLEVAFSPQDEINDDISSQIGYFNIGNFIGDPAFRSSQLTSYPDLDTLRNSYFEKYTKNYNLFDYIRLIKFFDNSLFKMIKDFVPARTSLASGIVVKQHLLERNRYPQPQMSWSDLDISGTLKPQWNGYEPGTVEHFEGGAAGIFNPFNGVETSPYGLDGNGPTNKFGVTQSWYETYPTILGSTTLLHDSQDEFFNGEFSGSTILISTQSLNTPYSSDFLEFNYTPILYKSTNFGLPIQSNFATNQVINSSTIPYDGEMLISIRRKRPTNGGGVSFTGVDYIKISKIDADGNNLSTPLGQITNLLIKYSDFATSTNYKVNAITELSTCYLYDIEVNSQYSDTDNYIIDYKTISTKTSDQSISTAIVPIFNWSSSIGNPSPYGTPYFNLSTGEFTLKNTPNILLSITASITTDGNFLSGYGKFNVRLNGGEVLSGTTYDRTNLGVITTISCSYSGIQGDILTLDATIPDISATYSASIINASWIITQSIAPTGSVQDPVIFEPYITTANYDNSDFNPLINNAVDIRKSSTYQDIDYNQGALVPVNFDFLISGSAQKAEVQDSNYTLARHINPRYNGSRTTSLKLNEWSRGDTNTYGKLPTIESNKTYVAYCDIIGGYPPEIMNSSGILIKYLIDENGTISTPNTSENSLANVQDTFLTGERLIINDGSIGSGGNNYRNIIRGGQRIEPILHSQVGHSPPTFTGSITLTDNNTEGGIVSDFQSILGKSTFTQGAIGVWGEAQFNVIIASTPNSNIVNSPNNRLRISSDMISEGISITLKAEIEISNYKPFPSTAYMQFKNFNTGDTLGWAGVNGTGNIGPGINLYNPLNSTVTIPYNLLQLNDEWGIEISVGHSGVYYEGTSRWEIIQSPTPNNTISVPGLWQSGSGFDWDYTLFTSESALVSYFTTNNTYQLPYSESGFFTCTIPWSIYPGDEFRFEGREDRVFLVKDAYLISGSDTLLAVELNSPIPPSGSMNLDQFLIRRYVDDASTIIIEGFKSTNSTGPYIVSPEFVSEPLKKNIDAFIEDLTQKGLL